jgi:23S rRNA (uracil1939-C5)-methyltransferase
MEEHIVRRLGRHGDGVADGPVFVPRALPGEVVSGRLEGDRIPAPRIVTPVAERVSPPCPHYRACGACALMHARDDFVAGWKQEIVRTALAAHNLDAPFRAMVTSPPRTRRRAALSARRTKAGALVGFHGHRSNTIVAVPDCHVLTDRLRGVLPVLEALTRAGGSRKGEITYTLIDGETGIDIAAAGGKPLDGALLSELAAIVCDAPVARLTWDGEPVAQAAPPRVRFAGIPVTPPPGAFLQATEAGEGALRAAVERCTAGAGRIADLFAGCGTFALPLSARAEVMAAEADPALTGALTDAWRGVGGLRRLDVVTRDLFRAPIGASELDRFDAVVIDPPRAGAAAQTAEIARSGVRRVAALSCNPASFARDASTLAAGGYALDWVQVIDQFRWSAHVELAAQFRRP